MAQITCTFCFGVKKSHDPSCPYKEGAMKHEQLDRIEKLAAEIPQNQMIGEFNLGKLLASLVTEIRETREAPLGEGSGECPNCGGNKADLEAEYCRGCEMTTPSRAG